MDENRCYVFLYVNLIWILEKLENFMLGKIVGRILSEVKDVITEYRK